MYYHRLGRIPHKRHTQFRQEDGGLYAEELVSSKGFSGIYSNLYHITPPTQIKSVGGVKPFGSKIHRNYGLKQTHLNTAKIGVTGEDYLSGRKVLLKNNEVSIALCNPKNKEMDYYYKNAEGDEVIYIHDGSGELHSQFGKIEVTKGDYVVIPRTVIYKFIWSDKPLKLLIVESAAPIETPNRYRNELGQ